MTSKRKTGKRSKRGWARYRIPATIAVFSWFLLTAFAYVWCRVQVVHLGYMLSKTHRVHSQLLDDNKKLHLELARLKAPERVERIAIQQLGLTHPSKDQIVVLP
ncbi:MAG: cell division protein FtsL [Deltaproteobacteria bacterium]|nr:MAG: cell division protein FtsL [Deltaproteobacteria bacterium]